jgi:Asp-tRNA(Asn)/Glu-tRNA(Gln) amidotransferase A subunit family amidase
MRVLEDVHFIACPSTFRTAPPIPSGATEGGHSNLVLTGRLMQFVLGANFVGLPAISLPAGHDSQGA